MKPDLTAFFSCTVCAGTIFLTAISFAMADDHDDSDEDSLSPEVSFTFNHESLSGYFDEPGLRQKEKQRALELELEYPFVFNEQFSLWLRGGGVWEELSEPEVKGWVRHDTAVLSELWLDWTPRDEDYRFRFGRQTFIDSRSWWWDSEFDGVQASYNGEYLSSSILLAKLAETEFSGPDSSDPENEDLLWIMLGTHYATEKTGEISGYLTRLDDGSSKDRAGQTIAEKDIDLVDSDLNWLGIRYSKEYSTEQFGEFTVLLDTAYVSGDETSTEFIDEDDEGDEESNGMTVESVGTEKLRGWASDFFIAWQPSLLDETLITVLYATGSPEFRQTGVQENETEYHYYGSLYNPSLRNINIFGISGSWSITENSTLTIQHLDYRINNTKFGVENELDLDIETDHKALGSESGIILSHEFESGISLSLDASIFKTDSAYGEFSGKTFKQFDIEVGYSF